MKKKLGKKKTRLKTPNIDKLIIQKRDARKGKKFVKYCPQCGSTEYEILGHTYSIRYKCKKCKYFSDSFPEKEV
ncbi:MAG: hypothetical protein HY513_05120 [Candidatus Aenigmarchaeota archaeon]|nr:hypothetical protein [Candidatus Aenigmarchaeota archaeon]